MENETNNRKGSENTVKISNEKLTHGSDDFENKTDKNNEDKSTKNTTTHKDDEEKEQLRDEIQEELLGEDSQVDSENSEDASIFIGKTSKMGLIKKNLPWDQGRVMSSGSETKPEEFYIKDDFQKNVELNPSEKYEAKILESVDNTSNEKQKLENQKPMQEDHDECPQKGEEKHAEKNESLTAVTEKIVDCRHAFLDQKESAQKDGAKETSLKG